MTLSIRPFTNNDNDLGVALYIDVFSRPPYNESLATEMIAAHFIRLQEMNTYLAYALVEEEEMIGIALGFVRSWYQGVEYHLNTFCLSPERQGQGLGKYFMQALKTDLLTKNLDTIILDTDRHGPAQRFYEQNGFTALNESIILASSF